jgi:hypothetical protein
VKFPEKADSDTPPADDTARFWRSSAVAPSDIMTVAAIGPRIERADLA